MRKIAAAVICVILIIALASTVFAATGVTGSSFSATVAPNGTCQVTLDL